MKLAICAAAVAAASVALSGCATSGLGDLVKAANDLDPGCYKNVHIQATPMMLFGWAVPVIGGSYDKVCNPDQAAPARATLPLVPGAIVGGAPHQ